MALVFGKQNCSKVGSQLLNVTDEHWPCVREISLYTSL